MADYEMISSDRMMARLEDELSKFAANNVLDTGKLYTQIKWFSQLLNIAVFELKEEVVKLENYSVELPCDFYLLDSAWLCDALPQTTNLNFQAKSVVYTETVNEQVCNAGNCYLPNTNSLYPVSISACNMETVLNKTTTKEYVSSSNTPFTWKNPILLTLNNKKSVKNLCSSDCQNLFAKTPYEISIAKRRDSFYLSSTLKNPIIYLKYYRYPVDEETGLPLVPDNAVLEEALFSHLQYYFFRKIWLNGEDTNLENKIKFLKDESELKIANAIKHSVFPSFNKMIASTRRMRKKFASYEIMNQRHF